MQSETEIKNFKDEEWPKWLNKLYQIIVGIIALAAVGVLYVGGIAFGVDASTRTFIMIFIGAAITSIFAFFFLVLFQFFLNYSRKNGNLSARDLALAAHFNLIWLTVVGTFWLIKIFDYYHSSLMGKEILDEFFGCVFAGSAAAWGGAVLIGIGTQKKFFEAFDKKS